MLLTRRSLLSAAVASPVVMLSATPVLALSGQYYNENGVAIDGSDPVAYFTVGAPTAGAREISYEWAGQAWWFASEENRAAFIADPEAYAPQYGGYCAWAMAQDSGYVASTTPEAWAIVDGKLYLNFSRRIQRRWARDIPGHIVAGDRNWPAVSQTV